MNHPAASGCRTASRSTSTRGRRCSATPTSGTSSCTCTSPATSSPGSCSPAVTRWRGCGQPHAYVRTALSIPLTAAAIAAPVQLIVGDWAARDVAEEQPVKLAAIEGLGHTTKGAPPTSRLVRGRRRQVRVKIPDAAVAARLPQPEREGDRARLRAGARPAAGQRRPRRVPDDGRDRHAAGAARRRLLLRTRAARRLPRVALFFRAVVAGRAAVGRRADRRLGDDRGRPPAVGRLRGLRTTEAVTGAGGIPVGYATLGSSTWRWAVADPWLLRRIAEEPVRRRELCPADPDPCRPHRLRRARRRRLRRRAVAHRAARRPAASPRATTPTTRSGRCGRRTTSG